MKYLFLLLILSVPGWGWLTQVRQSNAYLGRARSAYRRGDALGAARALAQVGRTPGPFAGDPRLLLNLGHARTKAGDVAGAQAAYGQLLSAATTPPALGSVARQQLAVLAAGQGQYAQAIALLRQALLLDPANAEARYNYEVLQDFLARRPKAPEIPPPGTGPGAGQPEKEQGKDSTAGKSSSSPAPKPGTDRPGEVNQPSKGDAPAPPTPQPGAGGQPDPTRPSGEPGSKARGGTQPGPGTSRPVGAGSTPGPQQGLDDTRDGRPAAQGRSRRPGTEQATDSDEQLQTQRERLRQLNLSPAQARQLLEALRAAEQQYLQQVPRANSKPAPAGQPTW